MHNPDYFPFPFSSPVLCKADTSLSSTATGTRTTPFLSHRTNQNNSSMNSADTLRFSPPPSPRFFFAAKCPTVIPRFSSPHSSFSVKRRRSRNANKKKLLHTPTSRRPSLLLDDDLENANTNPSLNFVLDVDQLSSVASSKLRWFLSSSRDAYHDLRTLVTVDENNRIVFSCRKSTVRYTGLVLLCGFVLVSAVRVLVNLGLGFRSRVGFKHEKVVVRRDRSLGGREVVVATRVKERDDVAAKRKSFGVLDNQLSYVARAMERNDWRRYLVRSEDKLPKWWPVVVAGQASVVNQEEYQTEANRLIRGWLLLSLSFSACF